jgi:hypothetical protein
VLLPAVLILINMHKDALRNKMDVKFYCSKHPENELTFSTDLTKVGASSAYEVNVKIVIHPCSRCRQEVERIENAVDVLLSVKNGR